METDITARMTVLVLQLGFIIFAVRLFGWLARKAHISSVLGELIAGIVIGPYALGALPLPGFPEGLFPLTHTSIAVTPELYGFSIVASIILLFASGLETDLGLFLKYSLAGGVIGVGGVAASFVIGDLCGVFLWNTSFMDVRCLFLGIMSTATSVGITARILSDKKKMDSPEGVTILASAVFDDVLGIVLLAVVMGIVAALNAGGSGISIDGTAIAKIAIHAIGVWLIFTVLGLVFAKKIASFLKLFKRPHDFAICGLGLALLLGGLFESQGLAMIIGAYVMGLALSGTDIAAIIEERLHGLYAFFVPVFFAVMGMMVNVQTLFSKEVLIFGAIYTVTAVIAKIIGCGLPAMAFGFNLKGALRIGCGMVPRGEVALIIAGIGMTAGILNESMFGVVILMTLVTTLIAPPIISGSLTIPGSGTRKESETSDNINFTWDFGNRDLAVLVTDMFMKQLRGEGFFVQMMDFDENLSQARKDNITITVSLNDSALTIETAGEDAGFVKNSVYEVMLSLTEMIDKLKGNYTNISHTVLAQEATMARTDENVMDLINTDVVSMHLKGTTKEEILKEMVLLLTNSGHVHNWEKVLAEVMERENVMSTGMQRGIAFPHAKTDGVTDTCIAIGICPEGVEFNSLDGQKSRFFVMIVSPRKVPSPHILLLSSMSFILRDPAFVEQLIATNDSAKMIEMMQDMAKKQKK